MYGFAPVLYRYSLFTVYGKSNSLCRSLINSLAPFPLEQWSNNNFVSPLMFYIVDILHAGNIYSSMTSISANMLSCRHFTANFHSVQYNYVFSILI